MDYGPRALQETRQVLDKNNILYFGAGKNLAEARKPAILQKKGVKFAFLGYSIAHSTMYFAGPNRAGVMPIYEGYIKKDIARVRPRVDHVIVVFHWGVEYTHFPEERHRKIAHNVIGYGADLILGHHPHVLQGLENHKGKLISYSLGNLLFDQKWPCTKVSMLLQVDFEKERRSGVKILPLNRFKGYFPQKAPEKLADQIIYQVKYLSIPLNQDKEALNQLGFK